MKKIQILFFIIVLFILNSPKLSADIVSHNGKISIELENVELTMALNMIAQQNNLNLVLSSDVKGEISIRLLDVDIETALDAILLPNDLTFIKKDNIIIVMSVETKSTSHFISEVIKLSYADPNSIKLALDGVKTEKGRVIILDKNSTDDGSSLTEVYHPNKIFVSDIPIIFNKMKDVITKMDIQEQSISITVKIIETKVDSLSKLGLNWPTTITTNLGTGMTGDGTTSETTDLTDATVTKNLNHGDWSWGTLTVNQLTIILDMLEQDGNSKLVSYPNVTTLENHEAEIKSQTVIPIPTINRFTEAASTQDIMTFQDEEIGISLKVTPRINDNDNITLDVMAKIEDIIGYTGSVDAQKPITISRSITTRTTVKNGETAALGGLLKEDIIKSRKRVPLLGSIPLLGKLLFTSTSEEKKTTDLIILITPQIIP